jgi:hypothetical protein
MKYKKFFAIPLSALAVMALFAVSSAEDKIGPYQLLTTIPIPGGLAGFDISWVDSASERYYLADRTATLGTGRVDVIDAEHDTFLNSIGGFVGNTGSRATSGPTGILVIHKENELWAGDGDSIVKVVDLSTNEIVAKIPTGGAARADELAYDALHHIIMIANPDEATPFVTFISQETRGVLGQLLYPQATMGIEQSVWDLKTKRFYLSVPATLQNPNGEIDEIDPLMQSITRVFPITTPCGPAGLALLPKKRLITSCGVVLDVKSGGTLATISGVTGDELWFNRGDNRVYFGANPMGVVDAADYLVITDIAVGTTHSVAADSENNRIFVPVTGVGIKVYTDSD